MNLMTSIARSAGLACARFTAQSQPISKGLASIQQILNKRHAVLTCGYANVLPAFGTLTARALQGAHAAPLTRRAQRVAFVIGIALSIPMQVADGGSIDAIQTVHELADKQLTEKQEYCHNIITFKESSNRKNANNGSHWGYYQGRSISLKDAPDDYQFYWYWYYVQHRYGVTRYDEPNYCNALQHLRTKGWQ